MNQLSLFLLTLLIAENTFLLVLILLWPNRYCSKCGKVWKERRMVSKTCSDCSQQSKEI